MEGQEPYIGIFWLSLDLKKILFVAKQKENEINNIVNIGKFFYASHEKRWGELKHQQQLGEFADKPFDYLPRGTVSYIDKFKKFFITGGEWLNDQIKAMVIEEFKIPGAVEFMVVPGVIYDYHHETNEN
jgi:hypothetical protein